ncbi:hypothetical protein ACUY3K_06525 [Corynebacterium uberis]|nr:MULTISPECIES: hypothetical protein [Corynebacterium]MCZ9308169.1 hypothetical protein [Corynebacterium sp. c6VSa_13]UDL73854.1 hypothetical protein LH391_01055 [Corynebacterium uberis]UDL75261.1 hypothetical protein LH393_08355 [Corynebacterium uberis]UDL79758.1 hypothetical protein LH392_08765 [Corynebacterium uberis]UDL81890.1 hypothetical protein LH395_08345 [Corynebacterium uberis]
METWNNGSPVGLTPAEAREFDHLVAVFEVTDEHLVDARLLPRIYSS